MKNKRRHPQATNQPSKRSRRDSLENDVSDLELTKLSSDSESDEDYFKDDQRFQVDDDVEEVLPITNEDSSEYEDDGNDLDKQHAENDILEDSSGSEDENADRLDAWGKKKKNFFSADFVDEDRGRSYREDDMETAKAEENDALAIHRSFLNDIYPSHMSLNEFLPVEGSAVDSNLELAGPDWKVIDKRDKLHVLHKQSPEFLPTLQYFREKLIELKSRMFPLVKYLKKVGETEDTHSKYIFLKTQLLLHYCMNASYYMFLKSQKLPATGHPVVKKMKHFQNLLNRLQNLDTKLNPMIDDILRNLEQSDAVLLGLSSAFSKKDAPPTVAKNSGFPGSILHDTSKAKVKKRVSFDTETEKEVLTGYMAMKEQQKAVNSLDSEQSQTNAVTNDEDEPENADEMLHSRRSISYQISKNKGLLPHRKKEYRNPRVRHRMKFKKAEIRRKGQVRLPRKELQKYGGEKSGISTNVTKSIRIK